MLTLLFAASACRSRRRAPEDVRGAFDHPTSAVPSASAAAASPRAKPKTSGGASGSGDLDALPETHRKPLAGPCVALAGEPRTPDGQPAGRPPCRHAEIIEDRDPDGTPRYGCVFAPDHTDKRAPLPLLLFFHGQDETPAKVSRETELRALAGEVNWEGDAEHTGFIVLAPQARRIGKRVAFDVGFVSPDNADVKAALRLLAVLAGRGWVDGRRVYALGDGDGGLFGAMLAMLAPDEIAAFATFGANGARFRWSCQGQAPPAAVLYRACDSATPCLDVEQWLLAREQARAPTLGLRLGAGADLEPACDFNARHCSAERGLANHRRWPKGKEKDVLEFLGRFSFDER